MPRAIVIAGPNGAGKTTFAKQFLPHWEKVLQFVNADLIAAGISPLDAPSANVLAGRVMIQRLDALCASGSDLCLETTLSGTWLEPKMRNWRANGYRVELYYLCLSSPELAVQRVATRVASGGHHVPDDVVVRRFWRSLHLLETLYKPSADEWHVYNNDGIFPVHIESGARQP